MAIAASSGIQRIPFTQNRSYGAIQPEGYAVAHVPAVGDASLGNATFQVTTAGGFIYRLEYAVLERDDQVDTTPVDFLLPLTNLDAPTPFALGSLNLTTNMSRNLLRTGGQVHQLTNQNVMRNLRRFPAGTTRRVSTILLAQILDSNTTAVVYDARFFFTYWRLDSWAQPGFLQAFLEAPQVIGEAVE